MTEIWRDIKGFEGIYQVSNIGRVKNSKGRIRSLKTNNKGYYIISLYKNNIEKTYLIHRLVAQAFLPNPNNLPEINHKDEIKSHNMIWVNEDGSIDYNKSNLEWCDRKSNCNYGLRNKIMGDKHKKPILQITIDGCLVNKWDSAQDAANELSYDKSNIGRCCMGKQQTYKNYFWKYYNLDTYLIAKMNKNIKEKRMAC